MTNMLQTDTNVTMSAPDIPPPTPAEARKALDAAFAEIGIVFKKKPIVIKECGYKKKFSNFFDPGLLTVRDRLVLVRGSQIRQFVTTE